MTLLRSNSWFPCGLGTGVLILCLCAMLRAQPPGLPGKEPGAERPGSTKSSGLESEPSIYMLPDKDGKLQAVLNFRLEDFEALLDLQRQQTMATEPPDFSLSIKANGKVLSGVVKLTVQFDVETKSDAWTRIPLSLNQGILVSTPRYQGEGDFFLTREEGPQGFVAWIRPASKRHHKIELEMRLPVDQIGGDSRLRLTVPETVESALTLEVDSAGALGRVSENAVIDSTATDDGEGTRFDVNGLAGDFEISWRVPADNDTASPTLLQVKGELLATIDGRTITTEARLTIDSFGDSNFDDFRVRLPPGAHLVPGQRPGYTVVEVIPGDDDREKVRPEVDVHLDEARADEVEILLVTERPHDAANEADPIELAGFDVVGAVRQTGYIAVEVLGDWQIVWEGQRNVRRVETMPKSLTRDALVAGFEYLGQPCSLSARISPRESLIGVDPEYVIEVDDDQIKLQATLRYTIRGAKAFALELDFDEWKIDELEPHGVVDLKGVVLDKRSPLSIPLWQPAIGELELSIKAHRLLSEDATEIDVPLPRPRVTSLEPARVVVVAAENVILTPRTDQIVGLSRNTAQSPERWGPRQQRPLLYRGDTRRARFVADFRVETRSIDVSSSAVLGVNLDGVTVVQSLDYDVRYESIEQLVLELPPGLSAPDAIDVSLDGKPLAAATSTTAPNQDDTARVAYDLGEPRIGEFQVLIRYSHPWEQLPRDTSVVRATPLVMPIDGTLGGNEVLVDIDSGIELTPREGDWTLEPYVPVDLAARRPMRFRCAKRTPSFELVLSLKDLRPYGSAFVEKAWIQSWIDHQGRNDRAVFWVTSPLDALVVDLPSGSRSADVQVRIDGMSATPRTTPAGKLILDLSRGQPNSQHLIELNYRVAMPLVGWGRLSLEPPRFDEPLWVRRTYWQVVLPRTQHLLTASEPYNGEFKWTWNGLGWSRAPLAEQAELEQWVGTSHAAAMPSGSNRYLFSALGNPQPLQAVTVGRGWMVLFVGGIVLVLALIVFHLPAIRHPAVAMACAILMLAAGWMQPDLTFLAVQIAVLTVAFVAIGVFVQRWLKRRKLSSFPGRPRGSSIVELGSTDRHYRPPLATGPSSSTHTQSVSIGSSSTSPQL